MNYLSVNKDIMRNRFIVMMSAMLPIIVSCGGVKMLVTDADTAEITVPAGRTVLLPIEDSAPNAVMVVHSGGAVQGVPWNVRVAVNKEEYTVPFTAKEKTVLRLAGVSGKKAFCKGVRFGKADIRNPSPRLHFKPPYGWINDPNGMVYDGSRWHLFYQYNPYGAKWANMCWGHAVSSDLVTWEHMPVALEPDELGAIYSGSAVMKDGQMVAMYTSAWRQGGKKKQSQSLAFSSDGGRTFTKYSGNPVLTSKRTAFRDPKLFFHGPTGRWCVIIAAGDAMEIYSSQDLFDWKFESRFGEGAGCHGGVWECPDLFPLGDRWILISSCKRNKEIGSATQYFIGSFDGHVFTPDDVEERWLDHGTDHYAGVTWSGAPEDRKVLLAWMGNWKHSAGIPTVGWRGLMTVPRELSLGEYGGRKVVQAYPVKEVLGALKSGEYVKIVLTAESPAMEIYGMTLRFDAGASAFTISQESGSVSAELEKRPSHDLLVIKADNAVECFLDGGAVCMTCQKI